MKRTIKSRRQGFRTSKRGCSFDLYPLDDFRQVDPPEVKNRAFLQKGWNISAEGAQNGRMRAPLASLDFPLAVFDPLMEHRLEGIFDGQADGLPFLLAVRVRVPDATTLLHFRHLLEAHDLGAALFARVGELLAANGVKRSGGTIVDATLIEAPSSTKNRERTRDPEMRSTKKGKQWHFGMKVPIGADSRTGLVHHASVTAAHVHDSHEVPNLLYGDETRFYGDSAYRNRPLSEADKAANRRKSKVRAKVEHPFLVLKRIWGFAKVRYRGLAKNAHRAFVMLSLYNLVKWGRPLTGEVCPT
jgi:IS5 family transposase